MNVKIIKTPFGPVALVWSWLNEYPQILKIIISKPDLSARNQLNRAYPHYELSSCKEVDELATSIQAFLEGKDIRFPLDIMALDSCSPFQKAVLLAEYEIQRGKISTYKLIAQHIGKGGGARAVGNALAGNPFPIVIPCHRAIRSDGYVGGFQGGVAMKKALLEKEGIIFDAKGRVISPQLQYNPQ
jgi:methylated-DNA-[protein]-cysteine S-methyltransferase